MRRLSLARSKAYRRWSGLGRRRQQRSQRLPLGPRGGRDHPFADELRSHDWRGARLHEAFPGPARGGCLSWRGDVGEDRNLVAGGERVQGGAQDFVLKPEAADDQDGKVLAAQRLGKGAIEPGTLILLQQELARGV